MNDKIIDLLTANKDKLRSRIAAQIQDRIPRYEVSAGDELYRNVDLLSDALLHALRSGQDAALSDLLVNITSHRVQQGFQVSDFVHAILTIFPVLREVIRESGMGDNIDLASEFGQFEDALFRVAGKASDIFAEDLLAKLEAKNRELNRLNQRLASQEKALELKADLACRELDAVNEFNQRVIESLNAGLTVIDSKTRKVTMYTNRMEEIVGLPAEEVLGRDAAVAFKDVAGLPAEEIIENVRRSGRLPLSKYHLRQPSGRVFSVLIQAARMFGSDGRAEGAVVLVDDVSERELLLESFSRYVSHDLVRRVLARAEIGSVSGELHNCTVMFVDIRGFTGLAETLAPDDLHELLNAYFRVVIEVVNERGGFIDKFIGDNVMVIFDWRTPEEEGALAALHAAREINKAIDKLNSEREKEGLLPIQVGIGVNSGEVLLGNVGSEVRMDFTAIGDPVNVAARLQARALPGQVLVGPRTVELVGDACSFEKLCTEQVKGRKEPVVISALSF